MSEFDKVDSSESKIGDKLAPYNPTSNDAVVIAVDMLVITAGDVVYDLGCGDARFLVHVIIMFTLRGVHF